MQEERMKFVAAYRSGEWPMTDLCREFGISRKTGYKYLERFEADGLDGLKDQSRAPKTHPNATREKLVELILDARRMKPSWGPRKLLVSLKGRYPTIGDWPSASTVGDILKRNGLVKERKRRRRTPSTLFPFADVSQPNDVWCADFKGHFRVGRGERCDPLTITDAHSRFLLECRAVPKTDTEETQKAFERTFREYGIPRAIRTDNGSPFASRAFGGLSRLSVWWLKLGIKPERIQPGKPYQNGRHERMHLTLKQDTALPPRSSLEEQQEAFDEFRDEFNSERPHEALGYRCPGELYRNSPRSFPEKIPEVEYPTNMEVQIVGDNGTIRYGVHFYSVGSPLAGELVGLEEINERFRRIHFASAILGVLDAYTGKVLRHDRPMVRQLA